MELSKGWPSGLPQADSPLYFPTLQSDNLYFEIKEKHVFFLHIAIYSISSWLISSLEINFKLIFFHSTCSLKCCRLSESYFSVLSHAHNYQKVTVDLPQNFVPKLGKRSAFKQGHFKGKRTMQRMMNKNLTSVPGHQAVRKTSSNQRILSNAFYQC